MYIYIPCIDDLLMKNIRNLHSKKWREHLLDTSWACLKIGDRIPSTGESSPQ